MAESKFTKIFWQSEVMEVVDRANDPRYARPLRTNAQMDRMEWLHGIKISRDHLISEPSAPHKMKRKNYDFSLIPDYIKIAKRLKTCKDNWTSDETDNENEERDHDKDKVFKDGEDLFSKGDFQTKTLKTTLQISGNFYGNLDNVPATTDIANEIRNIERAGSHFAIENSNIGDIVAISSNVSDNQNQSSMAATTEADNVLPAVDSAENIISLSSYVSQDPVDINNGDDIISISSGEVHSDDEIELINNNPEVQLEVISLSSLDSTSQRLSLDDPNLANTDGENTDDANVDCASSVVYSTTSSEEDMGIFGHIAKFVCHMVGRESSTSDDQSISEEQYVITEQNNSPNRELPLTQPASLEQPSPPNEPSPHRSPPSS